MSDTQQKLAELEKQAEALTAEITKMRELAELDDRKELFRARWRRAADIAPDELGWMPCIDGCDIDTSLMFCSYGVWKFSTEEKCRAWIESEGEGVVSEMLNGGLW